MTTRRYTVLVGKQKRIIYADSMMGAKELAAKKFPRARRLVVVSSSGTVLVVR